MPLKPFEPSSADYDLLGVTPQVDEAGLKRAYRHKVKMWHPDRFEQKSALERMKAEERFKAVNGAYHRILMNLRQGERGEKKETQDKREKPSQPPPPKEEKRGGAQGKKKGKPFIIGRVHDWRWVRMGKESWKRLALWAEKVREKRKIALLCVLVSLFLYANWDLLFTRNGSSGGERSGTRSPVEGMDVKGRTKIANTETKEEQAKEDPVVPESPQRVQEEKQPSHDGFFSIGSTMEEVLKAQGPPVSVRGRIWSYGLSEVVFKEGKVERYSNFDGNLKVRLLPEKEEKEDRDKFFFTMGSTRDEVLAVQGTPTRIMGNRWQYGFSEIRFKEDRVISYDNFFGDLKVRLLPSNPWEGRETPAAFSMGSTQDEVLAVQGTPSSIVGNMWFYGLSSIQFRNGRVQAVYDHSGELSFQSAQGKSIPAR